MTNIHIMAKSMLKLLLEITLILLTTLLVSIWYITLVFV